MKRKRTEHHQGGRIIYNLPTSAYFKTDALNWSTLRNVVLKSPLHAHEYEINPPEQTRAMRVGVLGHGVCLEPERLEQDIVIFDGASKRGNEWKEFCEANAGKEIITASEAEQLAAMAEAVHANKDAKALLTEGKREVTILWNSPDYGAAKGRLDVYCPGTQIVDLKTVSDLSRCKDNFARLLVHCQMGFYQVGIREITGAKDCLPVYIVAVEQQAPHDVQIFEYDSEALAVGRDVSISAAKRYRECKNANSYPGVCRDITSLKLPTWMMAGDEPIALKIGGDSIDL